MAKYRDRTEDFKDAVRRTAMNLGYNEVWFFLLALFLIHVCFFCWEMGSLL